MSEWLVFVVIMGVGQFSPGPDMLLLTRTSLASGRSAGCWTALGITCGLSIHAVFAVVGVASLMARGGWLELVMSCLAVVYLLWLSYQLICSSLSAKELKIIQNEHAVESRWKSWKRGLLCNLLNPKVAVFLAGVTAPFLLHREGWGWPLILWATIVLEGVLLWCLWVCLLQHSKIRKAYQKMARCFDLLFGLTMLAIALVLIWSVFSL